MVSWMGGLVGVATDVLSGSMLVGNFVCTPDHFRMGAEGGHRRKLRMREREKIRSCPPPTHRNVAGFERHCDGPRALGASAE